MVNTRSFYLWGGVTQSIHKFPVSDEVGTIIHQLLNNVVDEVLAPISFGLVNERNER